MTPAEFELEIIRPALGLYPDRLNTPAARQLLLGTAIAESDLRFTRQIGGGPARGFFQVEPMTHADIWANYLEYRPDLAAILNRQRIIGPKAGSGVEALEVDPVYCCLIARLVYLRAPAALPRVGDIEGQAHYWKQYYNTHLGAGTVEHYLGCWKRHHGAGAH